MTYTYKTKGTCSTQIDLELEGNIVHNVKFTGGCNGNLQAIPKLVEGLTVEQVEEMYRYLAIANYEDRFVIPTSHREMARDAFPEKNGCGFTFGDGCHGSDTKFNLFNSSRIDAINITEVREHGEGE